MVGWLAGGGGVIDGGVGRRGEGGVVGELDGDNLFCYT